MFDNLGHELWVKKEICWIFMLLGSMVITCQNRDIYTDNVSNFHSILLIMSNSISLACHHQISAFCEYLQLHPQSGSVKWKIYRNIEIIFSNHSQFRQTHTSLNSTSLPFRINFTASLPLFTIIEQHQHTLITRAPEPKPTVSVCKCLQRERKTYPQFPIDIFSRMSIDSHKKYKHIYGIIRVKSHANSRSCSFLSTFMRRMNHWLISNDNFPLSLVCDFSRWASLPRAIPCVIS